MTDFRVQKDGSFETVDLTVTLVPWIGQSAHKAQIHGVGITRLHGRHSACRLVVIGTSGAPQLLEWRAKAIADRSPNIIS